MQLGLIRIKMKEFPVDTLNLGLGLFLLKEYSIVPTFAIDLVGLVCNLISPCIYLVVFEEIILVCSRLSSGEELACHKVPLVDRALATDCHKLT